MARDILFVGGTTDCPLRGVGATEQSLVVGNKVVRVAGGQAVTLGLISDNFIDFGYGISLSIKDVLKGIVLGVLTKVGIEPMFKAKARKAKTAFKNGFIVGGVVGGLEDVIDAGVGVVENEPMDVTPLTKELFQSILVQGGIAGLTNALLTWAKA